MLDKDRKVAEKYNFTPEEIEYYLERMGVMIYDGGLREKTAAAIIIKDILVRREK